MMPLPKLEYCVNGYDPFGMLAVGRNWESGSGYRYGFNGKENDDEIAGNNNALDFGARIYDARLGRWMSVDAAYKEYPHSSPYTYALNNPIVFIDPDGKRVKAINEEAKEIIKLGLTPEEAEYVKFNRKGMIKKRVLEKGKRKLGDVGGNYEALLTLVKEENIYEVEVGTAFEVHTVQGNPSTYQKIDMGEVTYSSEMEDNWELIYKEQYEYQGMTKEDYIKDHPEFSTELKPNGLRGISLYSDEIGGYGYSASGNHRVVINGTQTLEDQVENLGHELYGHEYFKSLGKNHSHGAWRKADPDYNHELEHQINDREKESKGNYQKHQ